MSGRRQHGIPRVRVLYLWLLLLVTAGVVGMHTLGHDHSVTTFHGHVLAYAAAPMADGPHLAADGSGRAGDGSHRLPLTDPTDVCIAVLVGALIALLLAAGRMATARSERSRTLPAVAACVRGPPRRPPIGLIVADLAVLRN